MLIMNNADLKFPVVKNDEGEDVQLTHGVYGQLLESTNRNVREQAFKSLYCIRRTTKNLTSTS
jgi:oligoendopeptidase F